MSTTFAVHVDCDNAWSYARELGIQFPYDDDHLYRVSLRRLLDLLDEYPLKASFFIIGRDLELPSCREFCRDALKRGHKLANHSQTHAMDFGSMDSAARAQEIRDCHAAFKRHIGHECRAFRAPGYGVSDADMQVLAELGYLYDSSTMPGPTALLITLTMFFKSAAYRAKRLNVWQNFFATTRAEKHQLASGKSLWRIPVAVMPWLRLPVHTSFAFMLGQGYLDLSLKLLHAKQGHHIMLLHGLDLADTVTGDAQIPITAKPLEFRTAVTRRLFDSIAGKTLHTDDVLTASEGFPIHSQAAIS